MAEVDLFGVLNKMTEKFFWSYFCHLYSKMELEEWSETKSNPQCLTVSDLASLVKGHRKQRAHALPNLTFM